MRFNYPAILSFLAACIVSSTALWIPSVTSITRKVIIENEPQQPYSQDPQCIFAEKLGYKVAATPPPFDSIVIRWLRAAFDKKATYPVVYGQDAPYHKDHFIELQSVRNALRKYPGWPGTVSLDDLYTLAKVVNQDNNIFSIGATLNTKKSLTNITSYITDPDIKEDYLCQTIVDQPQFVFQVVDQFLTAMRGDANPVVKHVGNEVTTLLQLDKLDCESVI